MLANAQGSISDHQKLAAAVLPILPVECCYEAS
jgi:hypothetical protein